MLKDKYDIIIVGASIAGLEAAKRFGDTDLNVLVLEKNKCIGEKVCAHGITLNDASFIPKKFLNFPFQKALLHHEGKKSFFPQQVDFISSIDRKIFLGSLLKEVNIFDNIQVSLGKFVRQIDRNNVIIDRKKIKFSYLIGADGSNSIVRKHLKLPTEKTEFAVQYIVPKVYKNFEIFLGDKRFGSGYAWIFPNKKFTSIGCGSDIRSISPKQLRNNFDNWLQDSNISTDNTRLEMSVINYDYRGYHFSNIYLVGDAAGLASGFTGKGMYPAFISAHQVANEILNIETENNLILEWVRLKNSQERVFSLLKNRASRKVALFIGLKILPKVEDRILKYI